MPLQISEIGIRMSVGEPGPVVDPHEQEAPEGPVALSPAQMAEIVRACTREVLASLRAMEER